MSLADTVKGVVARGQAENQMSKETKKQIEELDNLAKQLEKLGVSLETKFEIPLRSRITATKISK